MLPLTPPPEDLLLKDAHLVVALEDGRLDVVPFREPPVHDLAVAAGKDLCTLGLADVEVRQDLLELIVRRLRAHHRARLELFERMNGALGQRYVQETLHSGACFRGFSLS